MSFHPDAEKILSDAQKFLRQQQELYGDVVYTEVHAVDTQNNDMKKRSAASLPPKPTPPASAESTLFALPPSLEDAHPFPDEPWTAATTLPGLNEMICSCQKCGLGATRKNFVFGVGNPKADIVVVGEAPGADEDEQGEPFVGRAGQLLTKILEAIKFKRDEVYICNMLKCRPPNNRDPLPEEIEHCEPYLWKQLEIIKPKMILCVGRIAGQSLLKTKATLTELREKMHEYRGIPLMVTFHPAALLRNPNWKRPCWEDVQKFRRMYDEMKSK